MKRRNDICPRYKHKKPPAGKRQPKALTQIHPTQNGYWFKSRNGQWQFQFTIPIRSDESVPFPDPFPEGLKIHP